MLANEACSKCIHEKTCKYWQNFQDLIAYLENIDMDDKIFRIDITCKLFKPTDFGGKIYGGEKPGASLSETSSYYKAYEEVKKQRESEGF